MTKKNKKVTKIPKRRKKVTAQTDCDQETEVSFMDDIDEDIDTKNTSKEARERLRKRKEK